jgi:hypothetical protein
MRRSYLANKDCVLLDILVSSKRHKFASIVNGHAVIVVRQQLHFAEFSQDAVNMNGAKAEGVSQSVLIKRTVKFGRRSQPNHPQAIAEFEKEVGCSLDR